MAKKILIETSARHVHVSAADLEILFGKGHTLTNKKDLSQPGQFACEEKVTVKGPAKVIGPSEFPLVGGDRAFWLRTTGEKGDITVTIDAKGIGKTKLQLKSE